MLGVPLLAHHRQPDACQIQGLGRLLDIPAHAAAIGRYCRSIEQDRGVVRAHGPFTIVGAVLSGTTLPSGAMVPIQIDRTDVLGA